MRDVDLVVDHDQLDADAAQGLLGRGLHRRGRRLLVAVRADPLDAELARDLDQMRHGVAAAHDQAAAPLGEATVQVLEALHDEAELRVPHPARLHRRVEHVQEGELAA